MQGKPARWGLFEWTRPGALALALVLVATACGARWPRSKDVQAQVGFNQASGQPETGSGSGTNQPGGGPTGTAGGGLGSLPSSVGSGTSSVSGGAGISGGAVGEPAGANLGTSGGVGSAAVTRGPAPGVNDTTINLCYLVPLTGAAPVPTDWNQGATLYWKWLAQHGGINGRNVNITVYDTQSDVATAVEDAKNCVNQKMFTVLTLDRFEVESAVGQTLNNMGVPNVLVQAPPSATGSDQTNTFVITLDHRLQGKMIADYWMDGDLAGKRYAVVRENVPDLIPGVDALKAELATRGIKLVDEEAIDGQGNDFSATVLRLKQANAQVVWFYGAPTPLVKLAQQSQAVAFHPVWFANSISWEFDTAAEVGNANGAMSGARAFSSWVADSSPAANQYKAAYRQQYTGATNQPDDIGLVGWGVGEIMAAALRAAGRNLGWNIFRTAFQNLNFTPDVWSPEHFGPGARYGSTAVVEFRIDGTHWDQVGTFRAGF